MHQKYASCVLSYQMAGENCIQSAEFLMFQLLDVYLKFLRADVGYGVFAAQDITEGEFIGEYSGRPFVLS